MKFGVFSYTTSYAIPPVELGKEIMTRNLQSLFFPEHSHMPAKRESPWGGLTHPDQAPTGDPMWMPDWYENSLDPFIAMAAAATASPGLIVGSSVFLVAQRNPISFAKSVATLEAVIGPDRFICGVAAGWNIEEMRNHGVPAQKRWLAMRETVEAAIEIWTHDEAEYHGKFVNFDALRSFPKPATRPHPPVLLGGHAQATLDRIVAIADGWIVVTSRGAHPTIEEIEAGVKFLAQKSDEVGRKFITIVLEQRITSDKVERYRDIGVDRLIFGTLPVARDEVLRNMDEWAEVVQRFH